MKSSLLFIMAMIQILALNSAYARELDPETTEHSFVRNAFCGPTGAPKVIAELNRADSNRIKEIAEITKDINSLKANKVLINDFLKIKDDYMKSYSAIASDKSKKEDNLDKNLADFKSLLNSSLTLNAVNMLVAAKLPADPKSPKQETVFELCDKVKSNFCDHINGLVIKSSLRPEIAQLNKMITNVNEALSESKDPESVKRDLAGIYQSIPSPIAPEKVLADLLNRSGELADLLGKSPNKEVITSCINKGDKESCAQILDSSSTREELKKLLTREMRDFQKDMTNEKLDKIFSDHDFSDPKNKKDVSQLMNQKANEASQFLEKQLNEKNKLDKLGFNQNNLNDFREACIQKEDKVFDKNACEKLATKMVSYFELLNAENDKKIKADLKKIEQLTDNKTDFDGIQKMQQYVAEKYLRTCIDAKVSDLEPSNCSTGNDDAQDVAGSGSEIGSLNQGVTNVIGTLKNKKSNSTTKGELGPFSKSELRNYAKACESSSVRKAAQMVCNDINKEYGKIADLKETNEWEAFNKDYWVEKATNEKGYVAHKKKSNFELMGQALAQNANKFIPMFLSNLQFKSQIDLMTNQGMYLKQVNYMNDATSPWMTNYFSGTYYSIPTVLSTGAFNFSK